MLLFSHVGITTAVAKIVDIAFPADAANSDVGVRHKAASVVNRFRNTDGTIDYRMVIIGSMLPDIIDKPLALFINNPDYFSGRGIFHSLLFNLILLSGGILLKRAWLRVLWFGSLMHLLLDSIWNVPVTLFWPLMGWFPPRDYDTLLQQILKDLVSKPEVFIPEILGFFVVAFIAFRVIKTDGIKKFLKNGTVR